MTAPISFVASPSAITSTPLASGSSVPAWPALAAFSARRTRPSAVVEPIPAGLSRTSQPSTLSAPFLFIVRSGFRRREIAPHFGPAQRRFDLARFFERAVRRKSDLRRHTQLHRARNLAAQEARGALQRLHHGVDVAAAERHHVGGAVLEIRA